MQTHSCLNLFRLRKTSKRINTIKTGKTVHFSASYKGRLVKQYPDYCLISFNSVTNAVLCAQKIQTENEKNPAGKYQLPIKLKNPLNAGVPVDENNGFFEKTINAAHTYFKMVKGTSPAGFYVIDNSTILYFL